jgi:hypothetical protein
MVVLQMGAHGKILFHRLKFRPLLFHNYFHRRAIFLAFLHRRSLVRFFRIFLQVTRNSFGQFHIQ